MNRQITKTDTPSTFINPTFYPNAESTNASFSSRDERQASTSGEDELLSSLSNAYENQRARQVFEWETVRRRAESNATARYFA